MIHKYKEKHPLWTQSHLHEHASLDDTSYALEDEKMMMLVTDRLIRHDS